MSSFVVENLEYLFWGFLFLVFVLIFYAFFKILFSKKKLKSADLKFISSKWRMVQSDLVSNPKLAVLEGDKLLDYTLAKLGKKGNLGDKLKKSGKYFSDLDGVWSAHKLRNKIAHEVSLNLSKGEVQRAIKKYERALKDLKAL